MTLTHGDGSWAVTVAIGLAQAVAGSPEFTTFNGGATYLIETDTKKNG